MNIETETKDERDELIARLATENANLQSLAPALTLANRAIEQEAQRRDELQTENANLQREVSEHTHARGRLIIGRDLLLDANERLEAENEKLHITVEKLEKALEIERDAATVANNEAVSWKNARDNAAARAYAFEAAVDDMQKHACKMARERDEAVGRMNMLNAQEPVAWMVNSLEWSTPLVQLSEPFDLSEHKTKQPLYTAPQPKRKPLSDAEIDAIASQWNLFKHGDSIMFLARAIERAHGIKEAT